MSELSCFFSTNEVQETTQSSVAVPKAKIFIIIIPCGVDIEKVSTGVTKVNNEVVIQIGNKCTAYWSDSGLFWVLLSFEPLYNHAPL